MSAVSKRAKATSPSWSVSASMASTTWLSNVRCRANTGASQRWMMRSQGLCGPAGGGKHRVGPRHDRSGRFVGGDERVVDRRQRFVVATLRVFRFLPQTIAVVHPLRL